MAKDEDMKRKVGVRERSKLKGSCEGDEGSDGDGDRNGVLSCALTERDMETWTS